MASRGELEARIVALEKEIEELRKRPPVEHHQHYHYQPSPIQTYPYWNPQYPQRWYPSITYSTSDSTTSGIPPTHAHNSLGATS